MIVVHIVEKHRTGRFESRQWLVFGLLRTCDVI